MTCGLFHWCKVWHVEFFAIYLPWYPAGSNVKKFKNGVFATPHTPLFLLLLLLHCFKIHRCLEASCSRITWYQSHSGFLFNSFWFFFSFFWAVWYCLYFSPRMQNFGSCRYTVIIRTSCSSPRYTRDQISLSFGDGYRNQVKIILAKVLDHSGVTGMFPCFYFWGTSWFRVPFTTCCNIVYTFQNR